MELHVAYATNGGSLQCADHVLNIPTLNQASREFRANAGRVVGLAFAPEYDDCFHPCGISSIPLRPLGIATLLLVMQGSLC